MAHDPERAREICLFVWNKRGYVWDAYDQGRWAWAMGIRRNDNPHLLGHVNHGDWHRGWDAEDDRANADAVDARDLAINEQGYSL